LTAAAIETRARDPVWRSTKMGMSRFLQPDLSRLRELFENNVAANDLRALRTHFAVVATDLATGELVLWDRGAPGVAVAASARVPIRYESMHVGGRHLVDGALNAPVPVNAARTHGAQFVIAVDVTDRPYGKALNGSGMTAMAFQMMRIIINRVIRQLVARADFAIKLDLHSTMQGGVAHSI